MGLHVRPLLALATAALAVNVAASAARGQSAPPPRSAADGLARSELSLRGYTASVAYLPALRADDPAHRALLAPGSGAGTRVRVGQLQTTGPLQVGPVGIGKEDRVEVRYDLWLEGTGSGWLLQIADTGTAAGTMIGTVPLERRAAAASPTLVAALIPDTGNAARLVLRWGTYDATATVLFAGRPRPRPQETGGPNVTINRKHDEDTSALSRARLLAQRNETALVLASGERLSVSFQRSADAGERVGAGGSVRTRGLPADGPDFTRIDTTANGNVVLLTEAAVPRLRNEKALRFGRAAIATGNQVPGFPGSYGIWLKRAGSGWRLVFNHEADAWGSQHDPTFDAAELELQHSTGGPASRPFAVALLPTGPDRGRLLIVWGPHEWSADFSVGG